MRNHHQLAPEAREDLISRAWYSHDARWFNAVAEEFGMEAANRLNRKAVRATGAVEAKRLQATLGLGQIGSVPAFLEFMDAGRDLYVAAPLIEMTIRPLDERSYTVEVGRCFVADNIARAGIAETYQCAVFDRIQGWHDGLGFPLIEDVPAAGCAIAAGKPCIRTFGTAAALTAE